MNHIINFYKFIYESKDGNNQSMMEEIVDIIHDFGEDNDYQYDSSNKISIILSGNKESKIEYRLYGKRNTGVSVAFDLSKVRIYQLTKGNNEMSPMQNANKNKDDWEKIYEENHQKIKNLENRLQNAGFSTEMIYDADDQITIKISTN